MRLLFLYLPSFEADSIFYYDIRSCENSHYNKARNQNDIAGYFASYILFSLVSIYYGSLLNHNICLGGDSPQINARGNAS